MLKFADLANFAIHSIPTFSEQMTVRLCISCWLLALHRIVGLVSLPAWEEVSTPYGPMKVREFGPHNGPAVIAIHGITDSDFIRNEWNAVAQRLAALHPGFHVIVPDFHSGPPELRPSSLTGDVLRELISGTLLPMNSFIPVQYQTAIRPKAVVLGKSWGARMACEAGALDENIAVVLVVPALGDEKVQLLSKVTGDVAIFLAEDDDKVDFRKVDAAAAEAFQDGSRQVLNRHTKTGGHRITDEFVPSIVKFVEAARVKFEHDTGGGEL